MKPKSFKKLLSSIDVARKNNERHSGEDPCVCNNCKLEKLEQSVLSKARKWSVLWNGKYCTKYVSSAVSLDNAIQKLLAYERKCGE